MTQSRGQITFNVAQKGDDAFSLQLSPSVLDMQDIILSENRSGTITHWWQQYYWILRVYKGGENITSSSHTTVNLFKSDNTAITSADDITLSTTFISGRKPSGRGQSATTRLDPYIQIKFTKFDDDTIEKGWFRAQVIVVDDNDEVIIDNVVSLEFTVARNSQSLANLDEWFEKINVGTEASPEYAIHVKNNYGFYGDSFGSFGGINSYSGSGGGVDLDRVWESLINNTDKPDVKINLAHIPTIPYSNISNTPTIIDRARNLLDGDNLCYVDPEEGEEITIDDPGTTGTVLWGAESANQVSLSVNGVSKLLLKSAAIDGIASRIGLLEGYFSNGVARNAAQLGGHSDSYFATASALNTLANQPATASTLGLIKIGTGLTIDDGVVSVTGQTQGTVTRVDVGSTPYNPNTNGVISLPAYPSKTSDLANDSNFAVDASYVHTDNNFTSALKSKLEGIASGAQVNVIESVRVNGSALPVSSKAVNIDLSSYLTSVAFSDLTSHPDTLAGYGITDAKFSSAGVSDKIRITLGSNYHDVLTAHQSLSGYATESWVGQQGFITKAVNDLTNYYLKSDTYTKAEVEALIAAINQFHYEIAASTSDVSDPQSNVLYLIGPTGSGSDKYEEYVYTTTWVKIGDTSIDLSGYVNAISASGIGNYVSAISKNGSTITVSYGTLPTTIALSNVTGADDLKAIEALTGTSGLLRKTGANAWGLDTSAYITGIDSEMIVTALGYTPMDEQSAYTKSEVDTAINALKAISITGTGYLTGGGTLEANRTIDIGSTYKTYIGEGHTAYGWGNHASEGYLKAIDSEMIENALGYIAFDEQDFTKNNIQRTLGISDWALAGSKPGYSLSEISGTDDLRLIEALDGNGLLRRKANNTWELDTSAYLTDYTIYALTIKNSEGTSVLNYNPKTAAGELSLSKAMVGLGNVENTALSTWGGSQNITTLGTIATGVWHGTKIANEYLTLDMSWSLVRASATYDTEDYIHVN